MTNFPTNLDTFSNPSAATPQNAPGYEHDLQHANLNDAVAALQGKVGADNSTVATSFDYRLRQLEQGGGGGGFSNPLHETLSITPANNTNAIQVTLIKTHIDGVTNANGVSVSATGYVTVTGARLNFNVTPTPVVD